MSPLYWIALLLVALIGSWFAWRHVRLIRRIRTLESSVRMDGDRLRHAPGELAGLSRSIGVLLDENAREHSVITAERDRLAAVLDQLSDGVLIADKHGVVQYSNPAAAEVFRSPDPLGRSVTEVLRNHTLVDAWQRSRQRSGLETESAEIPGQRQFLQLIVVPDRHAGGSLLLVQDLTRMRRLETVRQDFVSNISHELRTPLASLKALAETLDGGALQDPEAAPRFLKRMVTEVESLAQMAEELLELSAIESGKAEVQLTVRDPRELLEVGADRLRMQAERAGLALSVQTGQALPQVRVDPRRFDQVLANLIHNAIKFTPPGGKIVLSAEVVRDDEAAAGSEAVQFSVTDTGQGISAEELPRIFERFYRTDRARRKGGTGLGLSIARHIVEAHGGRIWAESTEGRGSTFQFTVPALK